MAYIDLATLKLLLKITNDDVDTLLTSAINAACAAIDERCGRTFSRSDESSARVFRTRGRIVVQDDGALLLIDDVADDASLTVEVSNTSSDWTTVTNFELEPDSALDIGRPATGLFLTTGWSQYRKVRVTAVWGWPDVPAQIKQAALIQASRLYSRKDSPGGATGNAEWGLIRLPNLDPDVRALVEPFRVPGFGGA